MNSSRAADSRSGIRVVAVGDIMLGDSAVCPGFGFAARYDERDATTRFVALRGLLPAADIVFGNLESTISHAGLQRDVYSSAHMRGRPGYAAALRAAGFNVLSVANNHATQHGAATFIETTELLQTAGIACCGIRGIDGWACQPVTMSVRDRTIGILGYSMRPRQYSPEIPAYAEGDDDRIVADVTRLRDSVDFVIVSLHWGEEFVAQPSYDEVRVAHRIADAGARFIIGHHPHVVRPVEQYGETTIAYSLGNFVSDMVWQEPLRRGTILVADTASRDTRLMSVRIADDFFPVRIGGVTTAVPDVAALPDAEYRIQVADTVRRQRSASYAFALRNVHRFPRRMLTQLARTTLRNKLAGLFARKHA